MTVSELIAWLSSLEDQEAIVQVVSHRSGRCSYTQGGTAKVVNFNPEEHVEHSDLRENTHVSEHDPRKNVRTLFLGTYDI